MAHHSRNLSSDVPPDTETVRFEQETRTATGARLRRAVVEVPVSTLLTIAAVLEDVPPAELGHAYWHWTRRVAVPCARCSPGMSQARLAGHSLQASVECGPCVMDGRVEAGAGCAFTLPCQPCTKARKSTCEHGGRVA